MDPAVPLIACRECDRLHRRVPLPPGAAALCTRCNSPLYRDRALALDRHLALAAGGLVLFALAAAFPLLTLEVQGQARATALPAAVLVLERAGSPWVAATVLLTCLAMPLVQLMGTAWVLAPLRLGRRPWRGAAAFRLVGACQDWNMLEVLMLGVLVTYVKLGRMGTLVIGPALYALGALMVVLGALAAGLDAHGVWERLGPGDGGAAPEGPHLACPVCHRVAAPGPARCPRCGAPLRRRKRDSLARTWAFLAAAAILYVPANLLPVMRVASLGHRQADTILSGVMYFLEEGSWHLAAVIFTASIVVPAAKMGALGFLLVSVQRRSRWRPGDRTRLYRMTELVGRWSMVDVYVITLMVALVELGALAQVEPGPGATAFAAVVVLTLLAARSFDPRLIWDAWEDGHG